MRFARLVLAGSALAFAGIGVPFLIAPAAMAGYVDVTLSGALADNDVRAVYGGLQLGCAAFLAACAGRAAWLRIGLVAQLLLFGGLIAARFASLAAVGLPGALGLTLHAAEIVAVVLGGISLRRLPR
jgi:hypothetical protein